MPKTEREYMCYTRWKKDYLICLCKVDNPACDRYRSCEKEKFRHIQYEEIQELMRHDKFKRVNNRVKRG